MPRSKYSAGEKLDFIKLFQKSNQSKRGFATKHNIPVHAFEHWLILYEIGGFEFLQESKGWTRYPLETKLNVVKDRLSGNYSMTELMKKYHIRSVKQIDDWVIKYNGPNKLTATPSRRLGKIMGRKTTFEERVSITEYAIAHNRDYNSTAEKFDVSYQQVRSWVLKSDKDGFEALKDGRGRTKNENELTENERLKLENRRLKAELMEKEMQVAFAKKLSQIRNRR